ncbi:MAG TPA: cupredoxin domain-containing protein [Burkholderiaceae bacterium]
MRRRQLLNAGAALGASTLVALAARAAAQPPAPRAIKVVARKFVFIPNEIVVKKGESVLLEFTAPEVAMGFFAPALGLRTLIVPGETARVAWRADAAAGKYDFLCDVFCGDGHEGMNGHLVVQA